MDAIDLSNSVRAAQSLLGCKLQFDSADGLVAGIIVETEAYMMTDPASHSYRGMTKRNSPMFAQAGTIYVYFTYGMHYCMNVVTGEVDDGQAVLLRAIEPTDGIDIMKSRRRTDDIRKLTSGPARLTQALGIGQRENGLIINSGPIKLTRHITPAEVIIRPRIGIRQAIDEPWRFYIAGNPYVSRL